MIFRRVIIIFINLRLDVPADGSLARPPASIRFDRDENAGNKKKRKKFAPCRDDGARIAFMVRDSETRHVTEEGENRVANDKCSWSRDSVKRLKFIIINPRANFGDKLL